MAKSRAGKGNRLRMGLAAKVIVAALLVLIGWQLYGLQDQLADAQAERDQYAALVAAQRQENAALEADIAAGPTDEKLEEIARDELGLVKPGEYVFEPSG